MTTSLGDLETVIITKFQYEQFLKDQEFLRLLRKHGVDNWMGYDDALEEQYGELD